MPTLYVENVPEDLYKGLREQAKARRRSIAAEVIEILKEKVVTAAELKRRRMLYDRLARLRARPSLGSGPFPPVEEMIREDRER